MPLLLSEALPTDFDAITACQFAAFYPHNIFHDIIWPGPPTPENLEKCKNRQLGMMQRDGHSTYLKITDTDTNMGDIVAGSKWCVYEEEPRRDPKIKVDWFGEEGSEDRAYGQWIMEEFYRRRLERMKGPHCLLDICFVNPTHHRRGAGNQLVRWGVKRTDEMGVHSFVEATLEGRRLYEQNGFEVTEHVRLKNERWPQRPVIEYLFMYRPAKGKKGVDEK